MYYTFSYSQYKCVEPSSHDDIAAVDSIQQTPLTSVSRSGQTQDSPDCFMSQE